VAAIAGFAGAGADLVHASGYVLVMLGWRWPWSVTGRKERQHVDLVEKQLQTALVYEGGFLQVHKDKVLLPDGAEASREYILHPGAVAILALTADRQLVMERQYRYLAGASSWKFRPARSTRTKPRR
jgi:hypothetical protein